MTFTRTPMFEAGHRYRLIPGFGWIQLARTEPPYMGDIAISDATIAARLNGHWREANRKALARWKEKSLTAVY